MNPLKISIEVRFGAKAAVRQVIVRSDVKSYYASIDHFLLWWS